MSTWPEELHLGYVIAGTLGLAMALVSRRMRQLPISEPMLALGLGVVVGPVVLGLVDISEPVLVPLLLEGTRLLLAGSVMAAALRFPTSSLRAVVRPVLVLLAVAMPAAALVVGAAAFWLGLPVALAALLGACLSPTDPVLAASVVSGDAAEHDLPGRLRATMTMESGANDGLALPLVAVAIAVVVPGGDGPGSVAARVLWEVGGAVVIGVAMGAAAAWGVRRATSGEEMGKGPALVLTILLAVAVLGAARTAHASGVLAAFVAGLAYNYGVGRSDRTPQDGIDEAINRYAVLPLFILLGIILPWSAWAHLGWTAVAFVVVVLFVRRLPVVFMLRSPTGFGRRDVLFLGWFGPMGVSALFYLAHSIDEGVSDPRLFSYGTLAVAASVVAFGVTASPLRRRYAQRTNE